MMLLNKILKFAKKHESDNSDHMNKCIQALYDNYNDICKKSEAIRAKMDADIEEFKNSDEKCNSMAILNDMAIMLAQLHRKKCLEDMVDNMLKV